MINTLRPDTFSQADPAFADKLRGEGVQVSAVLGRCDQALHHLYHLLRDAQHATLEP